MFGWSQKPTVAKVKHEVGGEAPARVIEIGYGQYEVTVPHNPEGEITYRKARNSHSDPRCTFPNMEVADGAMQIPLDDIVEAILARVKPSEIAVALWADGEVRSEFIYAMCNRYSEMNVGDADRRAFLDGIKTEVHNKALDRLGDAMAKLEYAHAGRFSVWQEVRRINDTLEHYDVTRPPRGGEDGPQPIRIPDPTNSEKFKIGGEAWADARNYWRDEVAKLFPQPTPSEQPS